MLSSGISAVLERLKRTAFRTAVLFFLGATSPAIAHDENHEAIVIDGNTGLVLHAQDAMAERYPASLTKVMTLYLLFHDLEIGGVDLETQFVVSATASAEPPSKLGLEPGTRITVEEAIYALVTRSANDVAMVVAEGLAGSEEAFVRRMTVAANRLGMVSTTFRNPNGLPDRSQVTTAFDMALLGYAIRRDYPQYFHYFRVSSFEWRGEIIRSHNSLLGEIGVDGIKTGYTRASGYNLVTSVHEGGRFLIGVVMGGNSARARDDEMRRLLADALPRASLARATEVEVALNIGLAAPLPRPNPVRSSQESLDNQVSADDDLSMDDAPFSSSPEESDGDVSS